MVAVCPPLPGLRSPTCHSTKQPQPDKGTCIRSKDNPSVPLQQPRAHCYSSLETSSCTGTGTQHCPTLQTQGTTAWQHRLRSHCAGTSCTAARQSPCSAFEVSKGWAPASATPEVQLERTSCCAQPESRTPSYCRSRAALQTLQLSNLCLKHQVALCTFPAHSPEPTSRPANMLSHHMVPQQTHLREEAPDSASSQTTCT